MIIKEKLDSKENSLEQIANYLSLELKDNKLNFKNGIGRVKASYFLLPNNIEVYIYDFTLNQELLFIYENDKNGKYVCSFNLSHVPFNKKIIYDSENTFDSKDNNLLFSSPGISSTFKLFPEINYKKVLINFSRSTLESFNIMDTGKIFDKTFFICRNIESNIFLKLKEIIDSKKTDLVSNLKLNANILEIISSCFDYLLSEENANNEAIIENKDIEAIFIVKNIIEKTILSKCPTIPELSLQAGMSQTKMKKIFRQVFGESIHQYYIKLKMEQAKELISKNKYSISEVSYKLGYNSPSYFINIFKRHFKYTPKDFHSRNF